MLYEDCNLKPIMKMNILLNGLFRSPALHIFISEMSDIDTINNVWNYKVYKGCPGDGLCCVLSICKDMLP